MNTTSDQSEVDAFEQIQWFHQIQLPDGRTTPGHAAMRYREFGLLDLDFQGKRVLDIGCVDGGYSFFAEERGAVEVVSVDINDDQFGPDKRPGTDWSRGYLYCHKARESKNRYLFPFSVYDLRPELLGTFDIVLCPGVLYHLAHPTLALERINRVLKPGGLLMMETEYSRWNSFFAHELRHNPGHIPMVTTEMSAGKGALLARMARLLVTHPIAFLDTAFGVLSSGMIRVLLPWVYKHPARYRGDDSNYWVLDRKSLIRSIDFAGYKINKIYAVRECRLAFHCEKVAEPDDVFGADARFQKPQERRTNVSEWEFC